MKTRYVDDNGNEMKKVRLGCEINDYGLILEQILLIPKNTPDKEVMKMAEQFRNERVSYYWYEINKEDDDE